MKILKENFFNVMRLIVSSVLVLIGAVFVKEKTVSIIIYGISLTVSGYETFISFIKNIIKGEIFDEDTLMVVASIVAFVIGEYIESVAVIVLFSVGEILEDTATENSREKIASIGKLREIKVRKIKNNRVLETSPEQIAVGTLIEIRKGDRVPIDGVLLKGEGEFDLSAITGESLSVRIKNGGEIYSGALNLGDTVIVKTTKLYKDSTIERIISLIEGANAKKAKSQKFITEFSKIYTPVVVILAILLTVIPTLILKLSFNEWVYKSLSFLVVSCPCALVISVPLSYYIGIGSLAKRGILIKGSSYIDELSKADTVIFDKTGTLTKAEFSVKTVLSYKIEKEEVYKYICSLERYSNHPLSRAILKDYHGDFYNVKNVKEISGSGIQGEIAGKTVKVGNAKFIGVADKVDDSFGLKVYLSVDGEYLGGLILTDKIKDSAKNIVGRLKRVGVKRVYVLSGDIKENVDYVSGIINADNSFYGLKPEEKTRVIKSLLNKRAKVAFVGDGINDAPSLAVSDVGISMGGLGSEIAIENSNVVILDDDLNKIPTAIVHAKKVKRKVLENVILSIGVKVAVMVVAVITKLPIFLSVFSDVGVMLLAVLNSFTNYKVKGAKI